MARFGRGGRVPAGDGLNRISCATSTSARFSNTRPGADHLPRLQRSHRNAPVVTSGPASSAVAPSHQHEPAGEPSADASKKGIVVLWRSGNLLVIKVDGGDSGVTLDTAARWIGPVNASARARGSWSRCYEVARRGIPPCRSASSKRRRPDRGALRLFARAVLLTRP